VGDYATAFSDAAPGRRGIATAHCDESFLVDCFFLTGFFGPLASLLRDAFFVRFLVPIFDFKNET
jgi:hypothetical protein